MKKLFRRTLLLVAVFIFTQYILGPSIVPPGDETEAIKAFTREIEFDYVTWTLEAVWLKLEQIGAGYPAYLPSSEQHQLVLNYLALIRQINLQEIQLEMVFSDPEIVDPQSAEREITASLEQLYQQRDWLGPLAEGILQRQVSQIASEQGLAPGGQPIPPVLYHSTPLPYELIISPREEIRQETSASLDTDTTLDQHIILEDAVENQLDVSALVVPVGGVGTYPTMVAETTNLNWLAETIAHEWTHNYLTLRPLGLRYEVTPMLRIMNETTASIAGKELGEMVIVRYYPEFVPDPLPEVTQQEDAEPQEDTAVPVTAVFDYRAEMHETRVKVDALLAENKVNQAETYMEARRIIFWNHGYLIRKLNQAYFAFYGAYADTLVGAAGEDPVGKAVRQLRAQSPTLAEFVNQMSWMMNFEDLQQIVNQSGN